MTLTKRDKKLLTFLAIVLVLYIFAQFFILPALDRSSELEMELQDAEFNRQNLELQIAMLPQQEKQNEELTEAFAQAAERYYPILNSQEVDREITGIFLEYDMDIESLVISMPVGPSELEPYVFSAMAQEAALQKELAEALGTGETTESSDTASETDGAAGSTVQDQIYAVDVTVECSGNQEQMNGLLDYLMNECPAILVCQYTYQEGQQTVTVDENGELQTQTVPATLLSLGLQLFMCDQGEDEAVTAEAEENVRKETEGYTPTSVGPAEGEPTPEEIARMEATESGTVAETESGVSGESVNGGNEVTSVETGNTENETVGISAETE